MHPLLKPYNLFDINGVAISSGFHDIPQYQVCQRLQTSIEINDPNQYPSNGLPIWHGLPDIRPIEVTNS